MIDKRTLDVETWTYELDANADMISLIDFATWCDYYNHMVTKYPNMPEAQCRIVADKLFEKYKGL